MLTLVSLLCFETMHFSFRVYFILNVRKKITLQTIINDHSSIDMLLLKISLQHNSNFAAKVEICSIVHTKKSF